MFKKLFGQKPLPSESGISEPKLEGTRWVKSYQLELTNMEGSPVYKLTHQITVGSEIGNIVISDRSISARHATFTLKEGVVSVIDHGSASGTFVNNKAMTTGKIVILEEGDLVRIGDLEIKLQVSNQTILEDDIPELPGNAHETEVESGPVEIRAITPQKPALIKASGKKEPPIQIVHSKQAANALIRIGAMIGDLLLAFAILIIFLPFDEFKTFLHDVPEVLSGLVGIDWDQLWKQFSRDYSGPAALISDLASFLTSSIQIIPWLITYAMLRIISTLLLGRSISQSALGIKSSGNGLWQRVGGALRVILGFFTWPFLIFDLPAIVSRRTFKEKLTFTHLTASSPFLSFLASLFYFPFLLMLILVGPFFEGLEIREPVLVNDKIDERVVAVEDKAPQATAVDSTVENTALVSSTTSTTSQYLGLSLNYTSDEMSVFPLFRFVGERNKLKAQGDVILLVKENEDWSADLQLLKTFDLRQLLSLGIQGNFFLYNKYPLLYDFVYSSGDGHQYFKIKQDDKTREAFAKEFIDLIKTSFELGEGNLFHTMQVKSPFIKSFVDFRASFLALIEYKDYRSIDFAKIGNTIFMRIAFEKQKPFDLLIPLVIGKGRVYKITFDKDYGKDHSAYANKLYKFALFDSHWSPEKSSFVGETLSPLEVIDTFTVHFQNKNLSSERAQALYGFYYEKSAEVLKRGSVLELQLWQSSVESVLEMIKAIPAPTQGETNETLSKLIQNFQDIKAALENNNREFFGVSSVQNV